MHLFVLLTWEGGAGSRSVQQQLVVVGGECRVPGGALECLPSVHGGVIGVDVGCCCVVSSVLSTNVDFVVEDHCLGTIHPHW